MEDNEHIWYVEPTITYLFLILFLWLPLYIKLNSIYGINIVFFFYLQNIPFPKASHRVVSYNVYIYMDKIAISGKKHL